MALILIPLLCLVPIIYYYLTRTHDYWKNRGVAFLKPLPIFGNLKSMIMLNSSPGQMMGEIYSSPEGKKEKCLGIFIWNGQPALLLRDPELIKNVLVKDFNYFNNRNVTCDQHNDPIGYNNLFVMKDKKWKYLRAKLTPTFTSGRMKQMFLLIHGVSDELVKHIHIRLNKKEQEIEAKELVAKYTTDVISTCAFGIQSNSLNDPNATFREFGRKIFETTIRRALEVRAFFFMHWWAWISGAIFLNKESTAFFRKIFWEVFDARETSGASRNDFIDTLLVLKKEAAGKIEKDDTEKEVFDFSGDSLVAQSVLFFTAGFETTASTISHTLTELAFHQDIQDKLRSEILKNIDSHDGNLTYDGIFEMKYMDQVIAETLRKYPPMPFIDRVCTKDYKVPDSDLIIEKGTPVFVSLYHGLHYDPDVFPDPEKFDPERFTNEAKASRHPCAYIPFGEGPHICIGLRFAMMNVKTALSSLLPNFKVEPTDIIKMPLKMAPRPILTTPEVPLNLKFVPL